MSNVHRAVLSAIAIAIASQGGRASAYFPFDDRSQYLEVGTAAGGRLMPFASEVVPTYWDPSSSQWVNASADQFLCGLTMISGNYQSGTSTHGYTWLTNNDTWSLYVHSRVAPDGSTSVAMADARCVPFTHFAGFQPESLQVRSPPRADMNTSRVLFPTRFVTTLNGFGGALDGAGEKPNVGPKSDGNFHVNYKAAGRAASDGGWAAAKVYYWGEPPNGASYRAGRFFWGQGDRDRQMIPVSEGICFLAAVTGKFRGEGERVVISPGADGYWYLLGTSQQSEVGAVAECFWYDPR